MPSGEAGMTARRSSCQALPSMGELTRTQRCEALKPPFFSSACAMARPLSLLAGAVPSSRSRMTTSLPLTRAFSILRSDSAGTHSQERSESAHVFALVSATLIAPVGT